MNLKNKSILLLILGILLFSFFACSDDDNPPIKGIAQLENVLLKQTINGKQSLELTEVNTELIFVSQLTFDEKTIEWTKPTLEQSFDKIFSLEEANISVTNAQGTPITSLEITIGENNNLKVAFSKVNNSYSYMESATFDINVKTSIKENVTDEELTTFEQTGFNTQSIFYGNSADSNIKSNAVTITSRIKPEENVYNVKGDPDNDQYVYKLNIVYFVPSDIQVNPDYQERISTILLKHQLFVRKWMKHWGFEEKSFGLPLDQNGMVEIVTVYGKEAKSAYPYSSQVSVPKMKEEINDHYTKNGLEFRSEHTLVITATNGDVSETPFYGYGRWCFALDYPGMSYEQYNIDPITGEAMNPVPLNTALIGGLLHELGHGLNSPHVGPTYSQRNNSQFGTPLMGSGNQTYGKTPTFMHETTAAFMNNCQLSSKVQKTYYGETTASVEVTSVDINGDQCTIKGKFESTVNVNRVLIHFFNSNESHLQSNGGYTSIAFVTKPSGKTFEITIPIEELRVQTFKHKIGVTILMENGTRKAVAIPHTYRLEQEGGKYTLLNESIQNDGTWEVTTSHNLPKDDAIFNAPGSLVDGDFATCLSMVKPGKTYGGISVGADEIVWATVDFKKQTEFNTIILTNRNFQVYLNAKAISLYGSNTNNGSDWAEIKKDVKLTDNKKNTITFDTPIKYQYLKMTYDEWDKDNGSTMQFAEMEFLNTK